MRTWIVIPVVALALAGATACERRDDYTTRTGEGYSASERAAQNANPAIPTPAEQQAARERLAGEEMAGGTATAPGTQARVLTGKLDVRDENTRTFQLEGDASTFVAPSGADLNELDGEEVTVRIDPAGRVQSIEPLSDRPS